MIKLILYGQHNKHYATGGGCIALSTPNGVGNWFHKQWVGAKRVTNQFNTIKLHWTDHPERTEEWRNEQDKILGLHKLLKSVIQTFYQVDKVW